MVFLVMLACFIWSTQKEKLFGCMMTSTILMLFIFYLNFLIANFSKELRQHNTTGCVTIGLLIQFSYISALAWLTSMGHLMWDKFKRMQAPTFGGGVKYGFLDPKYKWYALFSWGFPLIITFVTMGMQVNQKNLKNQNSSAITPEIGSTRCFLENGHPRLVYFDIINALLLVINLVFFVLFMYNMLCGLWADKGSGPSIQMNRDRKRLKAVIKMFCVLGLTWIAEIISNITHA